MTSIPVGLAVLLLGAIFSGTFAHGVNGIWIGVGIAAFVVGALWLPLQAFFVAGFLGLLVKGRAPIG